MSDFLALGLGRHSISADTASSLAHAQETGNSEHQLYSQITFRFYDIWLGMVMVFDTKDASRIGTVHTKLSWSPNGLGNWSWVDPGGLLGRSFIPLGTQGSFSSHIIFAADAPVPIPAENSIRVYYAGCNGPREYSWAHPIAAALWLKFWALTTSCCPPHLRSLPSER